MKYEILLFFLLNSFCLFGQKPSNFIYKQSNRHEIKFNATMALLSVPEISYEYFLNKKSSVGISFGYTLDKFDIDVNFDVDYYILPSYRRFLGQKNSAGFFLEGNFMCFKESFFNQLFSNEKADNIGVGIGGAIGFKLIKTDGLSIDLTIGSVKNLSKKNRSSTDLPRLGVSIGKRFPANEKDIKSIENKTSDRILKPNELKLNLAYITYGIPVISYERILNNNSKNSIGISFGYALADTPNERVFVLPYYRFYFGKKEANGFFVELGAMLWHVNFPDHHNVETTTGFGGETAIGLKIRKIPNFPIEFVVGFARSYINEDILFTKFNPRYGLSIGRQF